MAFQSSRMASEASAVACEASATALNRRLPQWLAPEAADNFSAAISAIPAAHLCALVVGEQFHTKEATVRRLDDFNFANRACAVKRRKSSRTILHVVCLHHAVTTQTTRKLANEQRKRPASHVNQGGCTWHVKGRADGSE